MFSHIIGNEPAKQYLTLTAAKGTTGNSLLFAGPEGIGKSLFAHAFAKLLICQDDPHLRHKRKIEAGNHPDILIYRPEGKIGMHSIAAMRHFSEEVYLAPFEAKWKVFIIHEADRMLSYSANALLKTFEEPAQDAVIILLSSSPASLLPTVLSRCRTIYFHPLSENEIASFLISTCEKDPEKSQNIASMAQGSIGKALRLLRDGDNPLRTTLLQMFAKGGMINYKELAEAAAVIAERVENAKKEIEAGVRTSILHGAGEDLPAAQKQSLGKEVEGVVAMHGIQEAHALFEVILSWYRDMQLLAVNGKRDYLFNRDCACACEKALERGECLPIDIVQKALAEARLALERSTSLQICLENLFLKLNLLK
jgi:DNA polymerase-3 subunit delta'